MNNSEALISAFLGKENNYSAPHEDMQQFMNSQEESVLQQSVNAEQNDFFETKAVECAFISLRADKRYARYSQSDIIGMYNLVHRYIHLMGPSYKPSKTFFRIDDMSTRSIEVRFSQREDVSLNLYISETDEAEPDYEETYISYCENGKSILANDTMDRMVSLVKRLLEV